MTATQIKFAATDAGIPVASQEPSLTVGPSALDRLLAQGRIRGVLAMLGPAFVASVAYVDPGNFATNIQGGAQYGYLLLWVVLAANLMAMVVQYLSAKLGIVTGRALPELVRDRLPRPATWGMWVQGEVVAMATDVAEFIGAALGLNLLFGVPMLPAGLITGLITFAVLGLQARGRRRFELAIVALLGLVTAGFLYETLRLGPSVPGSLHGLVPGLDGAGCAVPGGRDPRRHRDAACHLPAFGPDQRPHAQPRRPRPPPPAPVPATGRAHGFEPGRPGEHGDARRCRPRPPHPGAGRAGHHRPGARRAGRLAGGGAALVFAVALLASGVSSSSVGTYAGEVIMAGFVRLRVPLLARRAITMLPALAILAAGANPTSALVLSQVVLSFGIPFALVPLVIFDQPARRDGLSCQPAPHHHHGRYVRGSDHRSERPAAVAAVPPIVR